MDRMKFVMSVLGDPHNNFPSIHVAGTNGKGSVCAVVNKACQLAGLRVGMYTSPHLIDVRERFQINGQPISKFEFNRLSQFIRKKFNRSSWPPNLFNKKNKKFPLTEFEFLTALAFLWFSEQKIDVAVVEVGLGGRLDATNILAHKVVSVITTISLEHTEWLGSTIEKIAYEKSGIIKPHVPVVSGASIKAWEVIHRESISKNSPAHRTSLKVLKDFNLKPEQLSLFGPHQMANGALAIEALKQLMKFYPINKNQIREAIKTAYWPGRYQKIERFKYGKLKNIILDGAHNPGAIKALVKALDKEGIKKVNLLFGALKDKNVEAMASCLKRKVEKVITVPLPTKRSRRSKSLAEMKVWQRNASHESNIKLALKKLFLLDDEYPILVTGSLYLVGAVLSELTDADLFGGKNDLSFRN